MEGCQLGRDVAAEPNTGEIELWQDTGPVVWMPLQLAEMYLRLTILDGDVPVLL